jgi:hypothetical protein
VRVKGRPSIPFLLYDGETGAAMPLGFTVWQLRESPLTLAEQCTCSWAAGVMQNSTYLPSS